MSVESNEKKRSPALALVIGFLPALTMMGLFAYAQTRNLSTTLLEAECVFSLVCCFAASFLLAMRKTALAIITGILLLFVNGAIAFFFGCTALLSGMKF